MTIHTVNRYRRIVDDISNLNWSTLTKEDLMAPDGCSLRLLLLLHSVP